MKQVTVKTKLSIGVTLASALLTAVAVVVILLSVRSLLLREAWAKVEDLARDASDEVEIDDGFVEIDDDIEFYRDGVTILIYWPDGRYETGSVPLTFPADTPIALHERRTLTTPQGRWLVEDRIAEDGLIVRAILSLNEVDNTLRTLALIALAALFLYACAMGAGSFRIAASAFRPVDQINQAAEEIRTGNDLSRRLPVPVVDDEIAQLAHNFNAMFERLEGSFAKERQFTSDASHELRTPVATILAQCEYALAQDDKGEKNEALLSIQRQAGRMSRLTGHLLALSRADRGSDGQPRERVDLGDLMQLVVEELSETAAQSGVAIDAEVDENVCVLGDQTMLFQMAINLVENAIKYRDPKKERGTARVRVTRAGEEAVLSVSDNGIGLPLEHRDKIWERFYRVDEARSGEDRGSGLGLSMVRTIIEGHGGVVQVESAPGAGSTFTVSLPLCQ